MDIVVGTGAIVHTFTLLIVLRMLLLLATTLCSVVKQNLLLINSKVIRGTSCITFFSVHVANGYTGRYGSAILDS